MDAITELCTLGGEAETKLAALTDAKERAVTCRENGWTVQAGQFDALAALLFADLERIGKRQKVLIDQLNAEGAVMRLVKRMTQ